MTALEQQPRVPVPEPALTPRAMVERASALRPLLRAQQAACEAAGRILPETNDAFLEAGFYRTLQPRRFGGYEFDLPTFAEVMIEITRGCPSSGWVLAFTAGHTHVLAKFPLQAQVEAYGSDGDLRAPFVGMPGTARPVDGGYVVEGAWDYASGIDTATHFFGSVAVAVPGKDDPPGEILMALMDRRDIEIVDNWDVLGMRGTGSKRVVVRDLFVPSHRTCRRVSALPSADQHEPEPRLFENPLYAGPSTNVLMAEIAAVAIGTGFGALDEYEALLQTRTVRGPATQLRYEEAEFQRNFGHAQALLNTARAALVGCCHDYMAFCRQSVEDGVPFTLEHSQAIVLVEQQCTRLAGEAVELLFYSAGSSAARPDSPLQRYYRDMATLRTHVTLQFDRGYEAFARSHFGIPQPQANAGRGG
jgi:3-hydroxy-9,10-secoandrosta-1,3,5(10)-triene-9,17-dione monooxygenase